MASANKHRGSGKLIAPAGKREEASRREEEKLKALEKEKRKMGPPKDEVLEGLNITYKSFLKTQQRSSPFGTFRCFKHHHQP